MTNRLTALFLSTALLFAMPSTTVANSQWNPDDNPGKPTDAPYDNLWSNSEIDNGPSEFKFDSSVAAWLDDYMEESLEDFWPDATANNSDSIRFLYAPGGSATVLHKFDSGVDDCEIVQWQGCATGSGTWTWKIWIRKSYYTWCENNPDGDPCRQVQRVMVHEMGHVGGFLGHNNDIQANTIMQSGGAPYSTQTGGTRKKLQVCDAARMQGLYGVADKYGPYADCFSQIANAGAEGMKTALTLSDTSFSACQGTPVTVSGRLDIFDGEYLGVDHDNDPDTPKKYKLDGNALGGRTIEIEREGSPYTTATATVTGGNNWSKTFTSATYGNWDFTAQFVVSANTPSTMETGLNTSPLKAFSITWIPNSLC